MNIIIVGAGRVGGKLVERLSQENHDIVVVENDAKVLENVVDSYDVKGVFGSGVSYDVLREAGAKSADLIIACTEYDEMNILCCIVAKKLGVKDSIARVRKPEYFTLFNGADLGIGMMVNPEYEAGAEIARILRYPSALKLEPFADGKVDVVEIKVPENSTLIGLQLKDFSKKFAIKVLVCAVERNSEVFIPSGEFRLSGGDNIYITASAKDIKQFFKALKLSVGSHSVMIVGGGRTAYYLATELIKHGTKVKIIERNIDRCKQLDEALEKAEIVCGDGTDQELLMDEGLMQANALVSLFDIDEQNIIISMFATSKGIKVVTSVDKPLYFKMLASSGVESVVSTQSSTTNEIVRYVRGKQNEHGSGVLKLYTIAENRAEVLEFIAGSSFEKLSVPLKDLSLKSDLIIASIIRNGELIIPGGNDAIESNDRVIVVSKTEFFDDLNDILR